MLATMKNSVCLLASGGLFDRLPRRSRGHSGGRCLTVLAVQDLQPDTVGEPSTSRSHIGASCRPDAVRCQLPTPGLARRHRASTPLARGVRRQVISSATYSHFTSFCLRSQYWFRHRRTKRLHKLHLVQLPITNTYGPCTPPSDRRLVMVS